MRRERGAELAPQPDVRRLERFERRAACQRALAPPLAPPQGRLGRRRGDGPGRLGRRRGGGPAIQQGLGKQVVEPRVERGALGPAERSRGAVDADTIAQKPAELARRDVAPRAALRPLPRGRRRRGGARCGRRRGPRGRGPSCSRGAVVADAARVQRAPHVVGRRVDVEQPLPRRAGRRARRVGARDRRRVAEGLDQERVQGLGLGDALAVARLEPPQRRNVQQSELAHERRVAHGPPLRRRHRFQRARRRRRRRRLGRPPPVQVGPPGVLSDPARPLDGVGLPHGVLGAPLQFLEPLRVAEPVRDLLGRALLVPRVLRRTRGPAPRAARG